MPTQLQSRQQWDSLAASFLPRTRLFTPQGGLLQVDVSSGELLHGQASSSRANLFFLADPTASGGVLQGWLASQVGETWHPISCHESHSALASIPTSIDEWTTPTLLEAVRLERGLIALTAHTLFLCAEDDGRVTLSRPTCSAWECFLAEEDWCYDKIYRNDENWLLSGGNSIDVVGIARIAISPITRVNINASTEKTKIVFFGPPQWSNGRVYYDLCKQLSERGYVADLLNYRELHGPYIDKIKHFYDFFFVGLEDAMHVLVDIYGIGFNQIIGISHWTFDIQAFLERYGRDSFAKLAGYGVVGNTLLWDSLTLGVTRLPKIVPLGVNYSEFYAEVSPRLLTVGCAGSITAKNKYGVEIKRGILAQECAEKAGLAFKPAGFWTGGHTEIHDMPEYYRSVDAVLVPSLTEAGGPMPATEAAAAGRLVISTPVGVFPFRAYKGMGIMAPLEAEAYKKFTTDVLLYYKENPTEFVETCRKAQEAAKLFDWKYIIAEWIELIESAKRFAVGTLTAERPPRRSVLAEFPHTAPTQGSESGLTRDGS
jgi:hypothetical protein